MSIKVQFNITKFQKLMDEEKKKILEKIGEHVEGEAKDNAPFDSGDLRRSIKHEVVSEEEVQVGTGIEYCEFVEFGTSKQDAQPYLTPAFEENKEEIKRIIEAGLRKVGDSK